MATFIHMRHDIHDNLKNYWSTAKQFFPHFYGKTMRLDIFFHILIFLHFPHTDSSLHNNDPSYERLWKLRHIFKLRNSIYLKYFASSEHLAVEEVAVLFQGAGNFQTVHTQETQIFWNKNL
jgi:hypothetical protein